MVPSLIVHCINELERRGLTNVGLYRFPGVDDQVAELYDRILYGRSIPNLRQPDNNTLAGCIKKFFNQLLEPLIPPTSQAEFVNAAIVKSEGQDVSLRFHQSIVELPQPNRDTLAFLMIHLQKVDEYSMENTMTKANLAKVFAPLVVGRGISVLGKTTQKSPNLEAVMVGLLDLPPAYWGRFLSNEQSTPLTGNMAAAIAGPSSAPYDHNRNQGAGATPPYGRVVHGITPKAFTYKGRNQRKLFNPPWK